MENEFPSDANLFSLQGTHSARVVSLHDGDTFTAIVKLETTFYKFPIRIARLDTCEMSSKDSLLKTKAFMARDKLFSLLTGKSNIDTISWRKKDFDEYFQRNVNIVTLDCKEMDKYGRVLADVSNFADVLVLQKLAYWYDGGKKLTEDEQKRMLAT
jgi:endonuclease YncB( thermonuclease family)